MVGARNVVASRLSATVVDGREMRSTVVEGGAGVQANVLKALFVIIKEYIKSKWPRLLEGRFNLLVP
jgi:hypothetical protein